MPEIAGLMEGYRRFRQETYPELSERFEKLAAGQSPKVMVISCADSRVPVATVFGAAPGELFVVRNVANLVPPAENGGRHHGTSAALEFAITALGVEHVVVMGHASCGGIAACLAGAKGRVPGDYIEPWVELANPARDEVLKEHPNASPEELQHALEHHAIRHSLKNMRTFRFVEERLADGRLKLHGAWFSIKSGELHWMDGEDGPFGPVPTQA